MVTAAVTPDPRPASGAAKISRWARLRPVALRTLLAAVAGFLLYLSFAPRPLWWLAPIAFALFAGVIHGRRARAGLGYGFAFGMAFQLPLLYWLQYFLGAGFGSAPWVSLSALEALLIAVPAAGMAVVSRLPGGPVWMAALFITSEWLRSWFPFGGFPWANVGYSQPEGLFLPLASLGGAALVGFAVVLTGCALAALALGARATRRVFGLALAVVLPIAIGAACLPLLSNDAEDGTITVAIIQGNAPSQGLTMLGGGGDLRRNHLDRGHQLARDIKAGRVTRPDVVIMPETFTNLGPDPVSDRAISALVADLGVPTLVGARVEGGQAPDRNVVIVWDPVTGPGQQYAKRRLVPFGEFVPMRSVARFFTPFVDNQPDMLPGTEPPVLTAAATRIGVAICFEVAYEDVLGDAARAGAQILAVPTNNAWYGPTEMSYQQLAMSRVRAVEHGRAVVVSATTGVSAIVEPDGSITARSELFTADTLVATVAKRSTVTLATRVGQWPEGAMVVTGLLALAVAIGLGLRRRSGTDH